jgi:outer membrane murein-binding lipoprotein Lpp
MTTTEAHQLGLHRERDEACSWCDDRNKVATLEAKLEETAADALSLDRELMAANARIVMFEKLQTAWLASPEAARRLESYRLLGAKCAELENECDALRRRTEAAERALHDIGESRAAALCTLKYEDGDILVGDLVRRVLYGH